MVDKTMFPPTADNPDRAQVTGSGNDFVVTFTQGQVLKYLRQDGTWSVPPGGGGGSAVWGGITGTLSDQTDLQSALNLKANAASISAVGYSGAYADLTGKPTLGTVSPINLNASTSQFLRGDGTWATVTDVNAVWGNITGTLSSQGDLNTALGLKANLAGPTFTGVPAAPTAAQDTNTTQLATTAFVMAQAGNSVPNMDGTGSSGSSGRYARMDHVHPSDTSRAPLASPVFTGVPQGPTAAVGTNTTQLATTAFVQAALNGPAFSAYRTTTDQSITSATTTEAVLNAELWDTASCFDTSTGRFTPNVAGRYQLNAGITLVATGLTEARVYIHKNGAFYKRGEVQISPSTGFVEVVASCVMDMNGTTDYASVFVYANGTSPTISQGSTTAYFDGFLTTGGGTGGGGGGGASWGSITGTLSSQTDLQTALDAKVAGPASAGSGNVMGFSGTSGKVAYDTGFIASTLVGMASPIGTAGNVVTTSTAGSRTIVEASIVAANLPTMASAAAGSGNLIQSAGANRTQSDSGVAVANVPTMASNAAASGRIITSAGTNKTLQDSGTLLTALATLASPTFTGTPAAPTAATGTSTTQLATTAFVQQEKLIPQNSQSAAYTCVLADANKHLYHPSADTTARTWTIPANSSVAYPVGTTLTFVNDSSAGVITIAITTDTLVLAGAGTTGSRSLAANGVATAIKMTSTRWQINGTGLT